MSKDDVFERARARYEDHKRTLPSGLVAMFDIQTRILRRYDDYVRRAISKTDAIAISLKDLLDWYNNVALWVKNDPDAFNAIVESYALAIQAKNYDAQQDAHKQLEMLRKLKGLEVIPDVPIYPLM